MQQPEQTTRRDIRPADHEERLRAAERVATWYLGDPGWAGKLIGAYLWPDEALSNLKCEMGEE